LVSSIIPARNEEASIARTVESVAAQPEVGEVIVVNDQSTDGTAAKLAELETRIPELRILEAGELPVGWVGKNHAASVGAAAARGDWLLFTDADTFHFPGSTRSALNDAADNDAALVSYSPEQEMHSFGERALIPYIYCRLAARFPYDKVNDPKCPDAAANGQYLMILRDVYEAVGGHAAVAGEVLEDVALAQRVKTAGYRIYFTAPLGIVRTRMYRSFSDMWEGWTKNLYPLTGGKFKTSASVIASTIAVLGFVLLSHMESRLNHGLFFVWVWIIFWVGSAHLRYGFELRKNLYPRSYIRYYLLGLGLYGAIFIVSWWKNTRGNVTWKGREYPARVHSGMS
jgi:glycosyltransferase involved in cell wall biosynthesis